MSFHSFIPHLYTVFSILSSEYINTKNRTLDNALIGILSLLFGILITCIHQYFDIIIDFYFIYTNKITDTFEPDKVNPKIYSPENIIKYKYSIDTRKTN
jgi:hypothetical protein